MGVIKRGILGGFSNKVGNIVGSTWKGRAVIKSLPLSVANPRTTPQVSQRSKFAGISVFASLILSSWVKPLWDRFAGDISGYNAFCKENIVHVSSAGVVDYSSVVFSKGKMVVPTIDTIVADVSLATVAGNITLPTDITWGQIGESLFVLAVNITEEIVLGVATYTGDPTDTIAYSIASADFNVGDDIGLYCAIKRADGTQVSNSAGTAIIAVA
jgi:hypothetical protein